VTRPTDGGPRVGIICVAGAVRYHGRPIEVERVPDRPGHLQCPFCTSYDVARLYLASMRLDSCVCETCGARWDEDAVSGAFKGRSSRESAIMPRET
jgi:hypothetical protein